MLIGSYKVKWIEIGWTYAAAAVYARRTSAIRFLLPWVKVWEGRSFPLGTVRRMLPGEYQRHFKDAVNEWERRKNGFNHEHRHARQKDQESDVQCCQFVPTL